MPVLRSCIGHFFIGGSLWHLRRKARERARAKVEAATKMGNISKNFSRSEFGCQCGCGFEACDLELIFVIQDSCDHFAEKLGLEKVVAHINSGNRCSTHNEREGGSAKSKHVAGIACDYRIDGVHADDVADYLEEKYPEKYGIGRYNGRTHIDVRPNKARWDMR